MIYSFCAWKEAEVVANALVDSSVVVETSVGDWAVFEVNRTLTGT